MTLNYEVIVERCPSPNGMIGGWIPIVKSLSTCWKTLVRWLGSQEPAHRKVGRKPHPASRGFLNMVGLTCSKFMSDCPTLVIYLFIYLIVLQNLQMPQFGELIVKRKKCQDWRSGFICSISSRIFMRQNSWLFEQVLGQKSQP